MEIRFRSIFLAFGFLAAGLSWTGVLAQSDEEEQTNLIQPQIERSEFDESLIDSDDFEIAIYAVIWRSKTSIPTSSSGSNSAITCRKISLCRLPTASARSGKPVSKD